MRNNLKITVQCAAILGLGLVGTNSMADEPDQLFCAASQVIMCPEQGECTRGQPETANLPRILKIDLKKNEVTSLTSGGERRTSKILNQVNDNDVYVLQGAENGKGWTATVNKHDGRMTVTASSPGDAYAVFGVCVSTF